MRSAVNAHATAPVTAEQSEIAHAGLGKPCHVTQLNTRQNTHESIVQSGYPGGWGTPNPFAAVANSPASSNPTDGAMEHR